MSSGKSVAVALRAYVRGRDRVWEHERKREGAPELPRETEFGRLPAPPRFGVAVADALDFRRGPAAWRDRDPPPG